ncbi:MAG: transposase [Desulfatiglandales bacterium]
MARQLRIEFPGAWYHVTSRGYERKKIFVDNKDRQKFLAILAANVEIYRIQVLAYVLMENHFHLLFMTPEGNLNVFMHRLNTTYTVYFNSRHRRAGHLLHGRYKSIVIDADSHLVEISRYLHLNPVRIKKFSKKKIAFKRKILSNNPWSSYHGYSSLGKREPFMSYEPVLSAMGGRNDVKGRRAYREFVLTGIRDDMNITYWKDVRSQVILGSEKFVSWIKERFLKGKTKKRARDKVFSKYGKILPPVELTAVAEAVAKHFHVESDELIMKRSRHRQARRFLLGLCYDLMGGKKTLYDIGLELGPVGVAAISRNRTILQEELSQNKKLSKMYMKIREEIKQNH